MDSDLPLLALAVIIGLAVCVCVHIWAKKKSDHLNWTHPGAKPPPIGMPKMPDDTPPEPIPNGAYVTHEPLTLGDWEVQKQEIFIVSFNRIFATNELAIDLEPHLPVLRKALEDGQIALAVDETHMAGAVNAMVDSVQHLERPMQEMGEAMTDTMNRAMGHLDESMRRMSVNTDRALSGIDRDTPFSVTTTVRRTTTTTGQPQDTKRHEKPVVKKPDAPPSPSRYDLLSDDDHDF